MSPLPALRCPGSGMGVREGAEVRVSYPSVPPERVSWGAQGPSQGGEESASVLRRGRHAGRAEAFRRPKPSSYGLRRALRVCPLS